jgi:type 1 glutamine amidotransferase
MRSPLLYSLLLLCLLAVYPCSAAEKDPVAPRVILVSFEDEYSAARTLPAFGKILTDRFGWRCTTLAGEAGAGIRGLEALATADALVLYVRRRALPPPQMDAIRRYLQAGKPLVALRTSCHAFQAGDARGPGLVEWPEFGRDVLGANYRGHTGHDHPTRVRIVPRAVDHPVLAGVTPDRWTTSSWLYKVSPIDPQATVLMTGTWQDTTEPVAWTRRYGKGRVFFTSLGHPDDFRLPQFKRLLINALCWAMDRPVPPHAAEAASEPQP